MRIEAGGVAYADVAMRVGVYPGVRAPFVPGYDFVGYVTALGDGAEVFVAFGQRVVGRGTLRSTSR